MADFLFVSSQAFYYDAEVQAQYAARNGGAENLVRVNDVFFGYGFLSALIPFSLSSDTFSFRLLSLPARSRLFLGFISLMTQGIP